MLAAICRTEATLKLEEHTVTVVQSLSMVSAVKHLNIAIARGPTLACMSVCAGSTPCSGLQHQTTALMALAAHSLISFASE